MAGLSDKTIVSAIKTLIEGDGNLYHASTTSKINKVYVETSPTGRGTGRPQKNYAEIVAPGEDEIVVLDSDDAPIQMGNAEATHRPYTLIFYFKQPRAENNDDLMDLVKYMRDAVRADKTLSTAGIVNSWISPWGYNLNPNNQSVIDDAVMTLNILTTEKF